MILGLTLCAACASSPDADAQPGVEGCYSLDVEEWSPALQPGDAPFQTPPPAFELLDSIGDSGFEQGQRLVRPTIGPEGFDRGNAYWTPLETDSIRVMWTTGYVMVELVLGQGDDGLEGIATARTDAVVPGQAWPTASAVAVRTPCSS